LSIYFERPIESLFVKFCTMSLIALLKLSSFEFCPKENLAITRTERMVRKYFIIIVAYPFYTHYACYPVRRHLFLSSCHHAATKFQPVMIFFMKLFHFSYNVFFNFCDRLGSLSFYERSRSHSCIYFRLK
jgi:hypothetical protein